MVSFKVSKGNRFGTSATVRLIEGVRLIRCPLNTGFTVVSRLQSVAEYGRGREGFSREGTPTVKALSWGYVCVLSLNFHVLRRKLACVSPFPFLHLLLPSDYYAG